MKPPDPLPLSDALGRVTDQLQAAAARAGRAASEVRIVVVTKSAPPAIFAALAELGVMHVGENRIASAAARLGPWRERFTTHFIGRLQANKVRRALPLFDVFHGIDGQPLLERVDRIAGELGLTREVLVQVNISGEASKGGVEPHEVMALAERATRLEAVRLVGLMTMAPYVATPEAARPVFTALREIRDDVVSRLGISLPELSMGMSGDAEVAVEEGATFVRIGTAIVGGFAERLDPGDTHGEPMNPPAQQ